MEIDNILMTPQDFQKYLQQKIKDGYMNAVFKNIKTGDLIIKFITKQDYEKLKGK